jgi:hypothetical protein
MLPRLYEKTPFTRKHQRDLDLIETSNRQRLTIRIAARESEPPATRNVPSFFPGTDWSK